MVPFAESEKRMSAQNNQQQPESPEVDAQEMRQLVLRRSHNGGMTLILVFPRTPGMVGGPKLPEQPLWVEVDTWRDNRLAFMNSSGESVERIRQLLGGTSVQTKLDDLFSQTYSALYRSTDLQPPVSAEATSDLTVEEAIVVLESFVLQLLNYSNLDLRSLRK